MRKHNSFQHGSFAAKTAILSAAAMLLGGTLLPACTPVEPAEQTQPATTPGSTATGTASGTAVLTGKIVFGPLTPVMVEGEPTPETPPEMFEGRSVLVFEPDGETLFAEAPVGPDGSYRIELPPGDYVLGFTLVAIETSETVPFEISLSPGQILELDISVDTGIR